MLWKLLTIFLKLAKILLRLKLKYLNYTKKWILPLKPKVFWIVGYDMKLINVNGNKNTWLILLLLKYVRNLKILVFSNNYFNKVSLMWRVIFLKTPLLTLIRNSLSTISEIPWVVHKMLYRC